MKDRINQLKKEKDADCAMAHMADIQKIKELRNTYEDLAVVCYINSTAELKAYSDVCVTSANALNVVRNLPNKNIYFIPDGNLGQYVKEQVPEKNVILNEGYCPIINYVAMDDAQEYIIGTEIGVLYELVKQNPNKQFLLCVNHLFGCCSAKRGW